MITPYFKVIAISRHEIKVVYSNGVKAWYKKSPKLYLYDERCCELIQRISFDYHYRAYISAGVVTALQRNLKISAGNACWNCQ